MPRLTNPDYLDHRTKLRDLWLTTEHCFGFLSLRDQRALHDYFRLSGDITEQAALEHRQTVDAREPSLAARAGKAYRKLLVAHADWLVAVPVAAGGGSSGRRRIVARAVSRPKTDAAQLARALSLLAREALAAQQSETTEGDRAA